MEKHGYRCYCQHLPFDSVLRKGILFFPLAQLRLQLLLILQTVCSLIVHIDLPLDVVLPELIADLEAAGVSLSRGYRANEELGGEKHQYGIPTAKMTELQNMLMVDVSDMYLCLFFDTGNDENAIKFFDHLVRDFMPAADSAAQ